MVESTKTLMVRSGRLTGEKFHKQIASGVYASGAGASDVGQCTFEHETRRSDDHHIWVSTFNEYNARFKQIAKSGYDPVREKKIVVIFNERRGPFNFVFRW